MGFLDTVQLNKYIGNNEINGKRGNILVDKIKNNKPFELANGDMVNITVNQEDMIKLERMVIDQDFSGSSGITKINFIDINSVKYTLKDFVKNSDFGGMVGSGAKKPPPYNYEIAIVNSWNKLNGINKQITMPFSEIEKSGDEIAEKLKSIIKYKKEAVYTGSIKMHDVSDYWKRYISNPDKTPKTDILINKYRISLKIGNMANLCSGKAIHGEGQALLFNALDMSSDISNKLSKDLKNWFKLDKNGKSKLGTAQEVIQYGREEFTINHKKMNETLNNIIDTSKDFKKNFVIEAMTGKRKFEGIRNSEQGISNYMLVASKDGSKIELHNVNSKKYIQEISKNVKIYISWKTSGTGRTDASIWAGIKNIDF